MERSERSQVSDPALDTNSADSDSVLIRTIITKASIGDSEQSILTPAVFERLGRLCFTQLLELRHRGAHSTVAQTFAAFCRRCATSKIPELKALPDTWYTNIEESRLPQVHALNCIKEIFTTSKLSVASEAYIAQGLELAGKTLNSNMHVMSIF